MKIKNKYLKATYELFNNLELSGRKSILRTRFIREIENYFTNSYSIEVQTIINELAIINEQENTFEVPKENTQQFINENEALDNDVFEFTLNEQNKPMLLLVSELVNNDESFPSLSGIHADAYYELFEECEKVLDFYKEN